MNQQPMGIRLALTQKPGFPANVVQVVHTRPGQSSPAVFQQRAPQFNTVPVLTSPTLQINTNTAAQYVRKPQEMTLVGPNGAFMTGQISSQQLGQVVNLSQTSMAEMSGLSQTLLRQPGVGMSTAPGAGAPAALSNLTNSRKPCNCTKSHCLKLYCECFAQGQLCQNCNCNNCMNNLAYEEERGRAIKMTLERNPTAFHPKIGRGEGERKHTKGCNCKRSGCLKNYCECYEAKISCSDLCRCLGCRNTEDSIERRSLMRLAAMGSLRSRQPNAFRKHLVKPPSETLPHVFFTWETIEATASCLLAQAEDAERRDLPPASQERIILEEFGRTMDRVIEVTKKAQIRTGASSLVPVGGPGGLPDDMTIGSTRNPLASGGPSSPRGHHHRSRGANRHANVHADDDEEDDDEELGPDDFHAGDSRGDFEEDTGHYGDEEEEEDVDDDMDLLERHNRQRRSDGAGPSTSTDAPTASSSSGKIPSVKFISRSGTKPYISRKGY